MVPRFCALDHARPDHPTEYQVEWCFPCGYGRVAKDFTPEDVAGFYGEGYYTHGDDFVPTRPKRWLDRLRVALAWRGDHGVTLSPAELPQSKKNPRLCDVGCGGGLAMSEFKHAGYEVVGIEPDAEARLVAGKIGVVHDGIAEALPSEVAGQEFDAVLLSHVLEHCIDPLAALRNVKSLMAPDGTLIVEVPNNGSLGFETYGAGWFFSDIPRHLQFFTENSLREALGRVGLRVTRSIYVGYTRQFRPEWLAEQAEIGARIGAGSQEGNSWGLLARTAFAKDARKYDSIRVHAVHA
jgi:SAM-dependent methyltransferase